MVGADINLPTKLEKRVPEEEEAIIALDRKATVDLTPGHDFLISAGAGVKFGVLTLGTATGRKIHTRDTYSGPIEGNYDALAKTSEKSQTYQEFSASISTVDKFRAGKFAVPFVLSGKYHMPIAAKNYIDERYFEISIASFFSTPMAAPDSSVKRKKRNKKSGLSYNKATGFKKKKFKNKKRRAGGRTMYGHH